LEQVELLRYALKARAILAKMAYYQEGEHEKHLRDIASMLTISGKMIDRDYIRDWSWRLGLLDIWRVIANRLGE